MVLISVSLSAKAQFTDSMTGLLNCPSAEMNESGTFMITNNFLNEHLLNPQFWPYNTFGYGFSITFFSRLEIGYACTIFDGRKLPDTYDEYWRIMFNQDRHFSAKLQLLREGDFGKSWVPSLAVGFADPFTTVLNDEKDYSMDSQGNGSFNRYYIVATKHFQTSVGEIAGSLGYQYNVRRNPHYNAPCAAVSWRPVWLRNRWFDPKFVFEYDARTPNIGFIADIWDDRFEAMFCLQNFQWVSFGLRFKLRLKGSE